MPSPNSSVLQRLRRLDKSSPDFQDQFCKILYEKEYTECKEVFECEDLMWFIDYLDEARCRIVVPHSPLKPV